jgi:hypothetical protein
MRQNIGSKSGDKTKHKLEESWQNKTQAWGMMIRWNTKEQIFDNLQWTLSKRHNQKILRFLANRLYGWLDRGFYTSSDKILRFLGNRLCGWLDCSFQTIGIKILKFLANRLCAWLDCGFQTSIEKIIKVICK